MNDRRMGMSLRAKVYGTVVRPALIYGAEYWALKKADERKLEVAEMKKMLRRMAGVTKKDRMRNEEMRRRTGVEESIVKVVERQKWRWVVWPCSVKGRWGHSQESNGGTSKRKEE